MPVLSEWQTFLAVQAGAAATLTGLIFVAGVSSAWILLVEILRQVVEARPEPVCNRGTLNSAFELSLY